MPWLWLCANRGAGIVIVGFRIVRISIFADGSLLASLDDPRDSDLDDVWRWLCG